MSTFADRLAQETPILLDGATGTELERRGVDTSSPIWSAIALIETPELVEQIHLDYANAGAEIITANTFRTQQRSLEKANLGHRAFALTRKALEIARSALLRAGKAGFVAGSIAPLEDCYSPELVPSQEELLLEHTLIAENLALAGADLLLIETMNSIREAEAAAQAARQTQLPFGVSFVCDDDGRLLSGESLVEAAQLVERYGPSFLGVNCIPAGTLDKALGQLKEATQLPIAAYGNIGHTDEYVAWQHTEDLAPDQYLRYCRNWLLSGVQMIGACCGSSPAHLAALSTSLKKEYS